jgi:hypothetical protein
VDRALVECVRQVNEFVLIDDSLSVDIRGAEQ